MMNYVKVLLALWALSLGAPSLAQQAYPNKVVRIVIGVSPGGVQDLLARMVAKDLGQQWGQTVIVDNHAGANGIIAVSTVAKAAPDGYTLLMAPSSSMETAPVQQKNLPFDPVQDFKPVVGLATAQTVVVINGKIAANNVKEFAALAQSKPNSMTYGSWGIASVAHLDAEAFAKGIGAKFVHVPYKGGAAVMLALASGQIDLALVTVSTALPIIKQGRIKAIAYFGVERSNLLPDVPTMSETDYRVDRPTSAFLFYVPAATPQAIIDKIAKDTRQVMSTPAFRKSFFEPNAMNSYPYHGAELAKLLDESRVSYLSRIKELNIKFD